MQNSKYDQQQFLYVKQRLDYHYLPTDFAIESTGLLFKLLEIIDHHHQNLTY